MAEFTGLTKAKAEEILGMSVVSGSINEAGQLIFTRQNGSTFSGGDFSGILEDIATEQVATSVPTAVNNAIVGTVFNRGSINGAIPMTGVTNVNLVNALFTMTANGNLTLSTANLPSGAKPNTQFAMRITQDGTGGRTLTLSGFKKSQGVIELTPTPNAIDMLVFYFDGTTWFAGMMGVDLK